MTVVAANHQRQRTTSTPGFKPTDPFVRCMAKVVRDPDTDCWLFTGSLSRGYGQVMVSDMMKVRNVRAHTLTYEHFVGPIPEGLELDHLCRDRQCCNPAHLEPVTHRENVLRGASFMAQRATATHCNRGHEFTPENTCHHRNGRRYCRACRILTNARKRSTA